jgi:hypothetical protein
MSLSQNLDNFYKVYTSPKMQYGTGFSFAYSKVSIIILENKRSIKEIFYHYEQQVSTPQWHNYSCVSFNCVAIGYQSNQKK